MLTRTEGFQLSWLVRAGELLVCSLARLSSCAAILWLLTSSPGLTAGAPEICVWLHSWDHLPRSPIARPECSKHIAFWNASFNSHYTYPNSKSGVIPRGE